MTGVASQLRQMSWTKKSHLVSTDASLIPIPELITAFDSDTFYWAKATPETHMREMLDNSLCFGMYELNDDQVRKFIGFARCVTDFVTFVYLTDVWVSPECQGGGLGTWMVQCIQDAIETMPYVRRSVLFTGDWKRSVPFYRKFMGMELCEMVYDQGLAIMERKGPGHPSFGCQGNGYTRFSS